MGAVGLLPWSGNVRFAGRHLAGATPRDTVKAGVAHVIEGHRVFTQLAASTTCGLRRWPARRSERTARVEEASKLFPEIAAEQHQRAASRSRGQNSNWYSAGFRPAAAHC